MSQLLQKRVILLLERCYRRLFKLYPVVFRQEFGSEMADVFASAIREEAKNGWSSLAAFLVRELRDLPQALMQEYKSRYRQEGSEMGEIVENNGARDIENSRQHVQSSWSAAVLGALPILTLGMTEILTEVTWGTGWLMYWNLVWIILLVLGLAVGWIKGFPRWSFAYPALAVLFGWQWGNWTTPGWRVLGHTFQHGEHWGWRAWVPLFAVAVVALLWTRSLSPLRRLVTSIWHDWTLASFALYSMMAWVSIAAAYDENHHPQLAAYMLASTVVLSAGALLYLRSRRRWQQIGSLLLGFYLSVIVQDIVNHAYWSTRLESGGGSRIWVTAMFATAYAAVMLAPALLALLHRFRKPPLPA